MSVRRVSFAGGTPPLRWRYQIGLRPWYSMQAMLRAFLKDVARRSGYDVVRRPADIDPAILEIADEVRAYTRTSAPRVVALCEAVQHLVRARIAGDIVECGVWRGGSMMAAARTLVRSGDLSRTLWLYDTYEGMSEPTDVDRRALDGVAARELMSARRSRAHVLAAVTLPAVRQIMERSGYPVDKMRFVAGRVEDTIPGAIPESIALLRLDTDWYESTRHELEHLVPRMTAGAVLIVDDYGHWEGSRRAVDEFMRATHAPILLQRIDYAARIGVLAAAPTFRAEAGAGHRR